MDKIKWGILGTSAIFDDAVNNMRVIDAVAKSAEDRPSIKV